MINILMNVYTIDDDWCFDYLKKYIIKGKNVLIVPLTFRDEVVSSICEWDSLYSKRDGKYYTGIVNSLESFGILEKDIEWINYFVDTNKSFKEKIQSADIIYVPGGLPDKMYARLREFEILDELVKFEGVFLGYSAGAVLQLSEYYLSPDKDYKYYDYYKGIGYIDTFGIEVHYNETPTQIESIKRFINEKSKPVYAIYDDGGMIIDNTGGPLKINIFGNVKVFST